ncbi:MAG: phytanoyl-CoA dioxygenase family protein [Gemmatimonadetes bacterium]|jgi:phytanoyl-CoA hydroxylase|nr:phytanoyl-CoA dioxygenase family protein [Gemmatimonadota bacterium]MBT4608750.1 phytanoyl-CoA dioxygenase family protein [Gemmatimonadota bacterium]MBT5058345.1 phytanoyl-CoA dioxygenase family protein [Gemmatimonadota bacterium]MBT5141486.1 phytanoyl-CoA dioxygenase family protein [Gemmatimonadota bacterium]MBT5590719.1 phytanoyl-CoA dioxygenase family protein [Gemmatimonadota bacterium]
MHDTLTAELIDHYRTQGFVVIDNFLDADELATWRQAVDDAVEQRQDRKLAHGDSREGDSYYDKVFTQRLNLWMDHDGVRQLMLDPRLGQMAATLEGVDGIRIWHDQALIKQPWANPTGWHLDNPYWSFSSRHAISIWVALDDATPDNGCLYFIPGSHQEANWDNSPIGQNMGELFELYPQWATRASFAAPMRAGSASFHNGLTAHGAGANMTAGLRRAMTCAYMPDGEVFNGQANVLPPEYIATLKEGDVLEKDELNPLLYHVSKDCPAVGDRTDQA